MEFFKHAYAEGAAETSSKLSNKAYVDDTPSGFPQEEPTDKSKFTVTKLTPDEGKQCQPMEKATVHYTGTLLDGTKFDSSKDRNQPFGFTIDGGMVIKCWDRGVQMLHVGQKAVLNCPPGMAYGKRGAGGVIPPDATLRFEIEVLDCK